MNFRRILSKSSLKTSSSSGKNQRKPEESANLQSELELLKQTIDSLKVSVESREAAIGKLAREKEKIYVELKSAQRTNRNLHQQLADERDIHSKEKDFLINKIKRLTKREEYDVQESKHLNEDQVKGSLNDELKAKDEVIYNIGVKYLKIKSSKILFQKKFEKLQAQNKKTCENIISLLQDNRKTLDSFLNKLLKSSSVSPNSKNYLKLLQINANLHYENTQLKMYILSQIDSTNNIIGQEHSEKCFPIGKQTSASMSEEKNNRHSFNSKHEFESLKIFKYIQKTLLQNVQGTIYRSVSDSCIARSTF